MAVILLILSLLLFQPAPPTITAQWTGPSAALITWSEPGCVEVVKPGYQPVMLPDTCEVREIRVGLGGDGAYTPIAGTVYRLTNKGVVLAESVPLPWLYYFPLMRM